MTTFSPDIGTSAQPSRRVIVLILPEVHLLDLSGAVQVFHAAQEQGAAYSLEYCGPQPQVRSTQGLTLGDLAPLPQVGEGDLILVPGVQAEGKDARHRFLDVRTRAWLRAAMSGGARAASICTGAFVLGEAGLLDGRRCTTHWASVAPLQARCPAARVQDGVLYVHDGPVTTSAGASAGIDMALSIIEQRDGPALTARVARDLLIFLRRDGSAPQMSAFLAYRTHLHPGVHCAQDYLAGHAASRVRLEYLAGVAVMSPRGLSSAFKRHTGLTPLAYQQALRLELAVSLLHDPHLTLEDVARRVGFEDARHFRRLWRERYGTSPSSVRARGVSSSLG
jgi:transcriptional regulator GlxA family with amidase domain